MAKSTLIKDDATRNAVRDIEKVIERIESIKQLPQDANLKDIIDIINRITNSMKRN